MLQPGGTFSILLPAPVFAFPRILRALSIHVGLFRRHGRQGPGKEATDAAETQCLFGGLMDMTTSLTGSSVEIKASKPQWEAGASATVEIPAKSVWTISADDDDDIMDQDDLLDDADLKKTKKVCPPIRRAVFLVSSSSSSSSPPLLSSSSCFLHPPLPNHSPSHAAYRMPAEHCIPDACTLQ